jgi:hypothetical protein
MSAVVVDAPESSVVSLWADIAGGGHHICIQPAKVVCLPGRLYDDGWVDNHAPVLGRLRGNALRGKFCAEDRNQSPSDVMAERRANGFRAMIRHPVALPDD